VKLAVNNQPAEHSVRRIILIIAATALITGIGLLLYIDYGAGLPRIPDASTGRIFEINVHGTVLYATRWEYWVPKALMFAGIITALLARLPDILW
jgi:hypothetical protein